MWALDGRYVPERKRERAIVVVAGPSNPCTVMAMEGHLVAHIGDTGWDEPTSRNAVVSICQYVVDGMSVADLWPYTFVIDGWRKSISNEAYIEILNEDSTEGCFYHPIFETVKNEDYTVFSGGVYHFPNILYGDGNSDILLDVNFRKAMFFLSSALRYPDHTSAFCIQSVEAVRAAFGDGFDTASRKAAWKSMHASLGTEAFSKTVSAPEYQSEKHGKTIRRSWSERAEVLAPAIEIAYRYALNWIKAKEVASVRSGLP